MWIPGYQNIDLGPDGGVFQETAHPKGCLHTTEGSNLAGAEAAYKSYPPHIGYDPLNRIKHQYISLDKHSYSLKGSESDNEYVIQVEIVGFARESHLWPTAYYKHITEDVLKPLEELVGIPRKFLQFYGEGEGFVLASPDSPIRLSSGALRAFTGWLGHQHIPAPDSHWDPGKFPIRECLGYLAEITTPPVGKKGLSDMSVRLQKGNSTALDPNGVPWGDHVFMVKYDPELDAGALRVHMEDGPVYRGLLKAQGSVDVLNQADLDAIPRIDEID